MLWRRAPQPHPPRPAQSVPEGESVRLAALQAAWRLDRQVGRRRLWWRWTLWGVQRVLSTGIILGLCAGLWFFVKASLAGRDVPTISEPAAAAMPKLRAPADNLAPRPNPLPPITVVTPSGMTLAFDTGLTDSANRTIQPIQNATPAAALPDTAKTPDLD